MIFELNQIPSEARIKKELRRIIFGHNITCPICHSRNVYAYEKRYRCRKCSRSFSLLSGTYLKSLKLSLRTLWAILWCYCNMVPVKQSQRLTHLSEQAVRHAFGLFRFQIPDKYCILEKIVQLDEAYFFGKKGKALMLAKQIGTRQLAYQVHHQNHLNRDHAAHFLFQNISPKTKLNTDGAFMYKRIEKYWPVKHRADIHSKFEFELTSEIEGMFGVFRTFVRRMYHHITEGEFEKYVREFTARFSSPQIFTSPNEFLKKTLKSVPFD